VRVLTRSGLEHEFQAAARHQSLGVYVLLAVIAIFCALALVNAQAMATAERGREFGLLRLVGARTGQVRSMVRAESLITVVFGLAVGPIVAVSGLAGVYHSLTGSVLPAVSLKAYGAIVAGWAVLAFAACILPTRMRCA
jgi:putative ABC transport system permease protein